MKANGRLCLLAFCVSSLGWAAPRGLAQEPEASPTAIPTLKVVTRLVAISAVVKDKDGEARTGLTKDDFVLKEDGKEAPIRYFSPGADVPLSFAVMLDTSGSQDTFVGDESLAGDVFFQTMLERPQDRATLVEFDSRVLVLRSMTNSTNALHLALSQLGSRGAGGTLLYDAIYVVAQKILAPEAGRKAMVILTDGGDNGSGRTLNEAAEEAQRADVQIYSILYSLHRSLTGGNTGIAPTADLGLGALQKLSESTGGQVFTVSRSMGLRDIFNRIAQDLRLEYELGYVPDPDTKPNSYHKLELKTKDKKLMVQARKGFYEPP